MGYRYSREDMSQIQRLVAEELTSREIAKRLNRSEAGIRNIRYREKLKTERGDSIKSLMEREKGLEAKIKELDQTIALRSDSIKSLEEKKEHYEKILYSDEESIRKRIEERLVKLKWEKPELFYITNAEQIVKLGAIILKSLLS